jgi:AcrR family transcriptional regulator
VAQPGESQPIKVQPAEAPISRPLRSDARRNHEQLLAAARDVLVERGPQAPLDEIARRAGVGIGTLYRRFPNRELLLRAVVLDGLTRTYKAATAALEQESTAFGALSRYLHAALDLRVAAVIPIVLSYLDLDDAELAPARDESATSVELLIAAAHAEGSLAPEVTFADIGLLVVRLSRPLPGNFPPDVELALAHRHMDLLINGLRPRPDSVAMAGPALNRHDLQHFRH